MNDGVFRQRSFGMVAMMTLDEKKDLRSARGRVFPPALFDTVGRGVGIVQISHNIRGNIRGD